MILSFPEGILVVETLGGQKGDLITCHTGKDFINRVFTANHVLFLAHCLQLILQRFFAFILVITFYPRALKPGLLRQSYSLAVLVLCLHNTVSLDIFQEKLEQVCF